MIGIVVPGTASNWHHKWTKSKKISIASISRYHEIYHQNSFIFGSTFVRAKSYRFCGELLPAGSDHTLAPSDAQKSFIAGRLSI